MAKRLFDKSLYFGENPRREGSITLFLSKDWNTLVPWSMNGANLSYFDTVVYDPGPGYESINNRSFAIGPLMIMFAWGKSKDG